MRLRPYAPADAAALASLYRRSVEGIGSRYYAPPQVEAWASLAPAPSRLDALMADGRARLVAVGAGDRPVAFADLERDGHLDFLYRDPDATETGAASLLYAGLEGIARTWGLRRLHAEASEAARGFFLRRGFTLTARRDFAVQGVPLHNYAIEKSLNRDALP